MFPQRIIFIIYFFIYNKTFDKLDLMLEILLRIDNFQKCFGNFGSLAMQSSYFKITILPRSLVISLTMILWVIIIDIAESSLKKLDPMRLY